MKTCVVCSALVEDEISHHAWHQEMGQRLIEVERRVDDAEIDISTIRSTA